MESFFARHERVALEFSGGKDSLAVLYLAEPWWDRLDVVWANPGNPYPEIVESMARIREMVPHFHEVKGDQPEFIRKWGHPTDILPFEATHFGRGLVPTRGLRLVPFYDCCWANLWRPMHEFILERGYTGVMRGNKNSDGAPGLHRSGTVAGIEWFYPIENWTDADVFEFLGDRAPPYYRDGRMRTSLDCINCTAWLRENRGMLRDLRQNYPETYAEIHPIFIQMNNILAEYKALYQEACDE